MTKHIFITGTDTEIGKTYVASGFLKAANQKGLTTIGFKPVASGCELIHDKLVNQDATNLLSASSASLSYQDVNPIQFKEAVAPHIIAEQTGSPLSVSSLASISEATLAKPSDLTIIEGFGGWHAPLNRTESMADYVKHMQFDVILVVGVKLGCINHAILTAEAIAASGLHLIGWVANCIDPHMPYSNENIEMVTSKLTAPLIATVGHLQPAETALTHFHS